MVLVRQKIPHGQEVQYWLVYCSTRLKDVHHREELGGDGVELGEVGLQVLLVVRVPLVGDGLEVGADEGVRVAGLGLVVPLPVLGGLPLGLLVGGPRLLGAGGRLQPELLVAVLGHLLHLGVQLDLDHGRALHHVLDGAVDVGGGEGPEVDVQAGVGVGDVHHGDLLRARGLGGVLHRLGLEEDLHLRELLLLLAGQDGVDARQDPLPVLDQRGKEVDHGHLLRRQGGVLHQLGQDGPVDVGVHLAEGVPVGRVVLGEGLDLLREGEAFNNSFILEASMLMLLARLVKLLVYWVLLC